MLLQSPVHSCRTNMTSAEESKADMMQGKCTDGSLDQQATATAVTQSSLLTATCWQYWMESRGGSCCAELLTLPWASPIITLQTSFCSAANAVCELSVPRELCSCLRSGMHIAFTAITIPEAECGAHVLWELIVVRRETRDVCWRCGPVAQQRL